MEGCELQMQEGRGVWARRSGRLDTKRTQAAPNARGPGSKANKKKRIPTLLLEDNKQQTEEH